MFVTAMVTLGTIIGVLIGYLYANARWGDNAGKWSIIVYRAVSYKVLLVE